MANCVIQYITRPNAKNGATYGAYLVNVDNDIVIVPCNSGRDITKLWSYLGNGNKGVGKDRAKSFCSMPDMTLNPAQYNSLVTQYRECTTKPFVEPKKGQ